MLPLYLLMHSQLHEARRVGIMETWLQNRQNFLFYSDHCDNDNRVMKVSDSTTYESNEEKFVNIVRLLPDSYLDTYDWFMLCDNDTWVNTAYLEKQVFDPSVVHGHVGHDWWMPEPGLHYLAGGSGSLVQRELLLRIRDVLKVRNCGYSDVALGLCMREHGIPFVHNNLFEWRTPQDIGVLPDRVRQYYSFHHLKTAEAMRHTHSCATGATRSPKWV